MCLLVELEGSGARLGLEVLVDRHRCGLGRAAHLGHFFGDGSQSFLVLLGFFSRSQFSNELLVI